MFRRWTVAIFTASMLVVGTAQAQAGEPQLMPYKVVGERELKAHVFAPADQATAHPAVLMFHGGGWVAGEPTWTYPQARLFQAQGLVAIPIEYRLSVDGITPDDAVADACDAFDWARANAERLGIDPTRVAGYGVSAGGQLVTSAGLGSCGTARQGPDLMMLWSPAVDVAHDGWFQRLSGGGDDGAARARALSPLMLAIHGGPPTIVVQGAADTLTPARGAEAFCRALLDADSRCELKLYPNLGHLLTRDLADQETHFDVDPEAARDGRARLQTFLVRNGYLTID